jgi:two-component system chemotaxis response regulator CheY
MTKTILTVDDSVTMRQMIAFTLRSAGFEVVEAADGEDALEKVKGCSMDLIITDINMPRMDGIALLQKLRALPEFRFTPILILTTEASPEMKIRGKENGATGWIVKPFSPEKLIDVVNKVL